MDGIQKICFSFSVISYKCIKKLINLQIDLQMMRDAKDVAEYIAYQRLGLGGKLKAGAVVVEQVAATDGAVSRSTVAGPTPRTRSSRRHQAMVSR